MRTWGRGAIRLVLLLAACASSAAPARAADVPFAVGAVYGYGDGTSIYGVQGVWSPPSYNESLEPHDLGLRLSAQVSEWVARDSQFGNRSLTDGDVMAELRYWLAPAGSVRPFIEAGFGFHLLSNVYIANRNMTTAFNFGSQAAAGLLFGDNGRYELSVLIHHVSNGGIKEPNWGLTYNGIRLRVALP